MGKKRSSSLAYIGNRFASRLFLQTKWPVLAQKPLAAVAMRVQNPELSISSSRAGEGHYFQTAAKRLGFPSRKSSANRGRVPL